jgi:hypothetical protein
MPFNVLVNSLFLDFVFIKFTLEKTRSQLALECGSDRTFIANLLKSGNRGSPANQVILLNAK